jgi:DNA-binding XRE family transcriptional regulator
MNPEKITSLLSERVKLVRAEYGLAQDKMAGLLGISKKTLIQVEKGRNQMNWSAVVAMCALLGESQVLRAALGDDPLEVVKTVVLCDLPAPRERTLGGRVWWREIRRLGGFLLQQNLVSGHYRILDNMDRRWHSSFNRQYIEEQFRTLTELPSGEPRC